MVEFYDENELMGDQMQGFACQVTQDALGLMDLPCLVDVALTVVTSHEIRAINADQRQMDKVTDVLSFPSLFFDRPSDPQVFARAGVSAINPESGNLFLGDIILCFERAQAQAQDYGHSLEREVAFLIIHSLLHLVGYDHMTQVEEAEMFSKQEEILNQLNIRRK